MLNLLKDSKHLSKQEQIELAIRYKNGCQKSKDTLIKSNARQIYKVALRYKNTPIPMEDIFNTAVLGYCKGLDKFDPTNGVAVNTYCVQWIRHEIMDMLQKEAYMINIPADKFRKLRSAIGNDKELDSEMEYCLSVSSAPMSFDFKLSSDDSTTIGDTIKSDDQTDELLYNVSVKNSIKDKLNQLTKREKIIISSSFGLDTHEKTLQEIGENLGISGERARQIRNKALSKLRLINELKDELATI
jgi:RNA polymerase primary sigma factor